MRSPVALLAALALVVGSIPAGAVEAVVPRVELATGLSSMGAPAFVAGGNALGVSAVLTSTLLAPALQVLPLSMPAAYHASGAFAAAPVAVPAEEPAVSLERGAVEVGPAELLPEPPAAASAALEGREPGESAQSLRSAWTTARALFPRGAAEESSLSAFAADSSRVGTGASKLAAAARRPSVPGAPVEPAAPRTAGRTPFMAGTFVYNLATSVMLVVQQALFFTLAQHDQLARGAAPAQADLHAAGIVFALATLTGAMRIPGNSLGAWLSRKTDQRNLAAASSVGRAAILTAVGALVLMGHMTLPLAAALYSFDWLIGGLEEVSRNTQTLALVAPGTREFKSWSTLAQFSAQVTGLFGPLFVVVLAQFKGLGAAGHVLAPALFGAAALLYRFIPKDSHQRAAEETSSPRAPKLEKWREFARDRGLLLPVLALALLSTLLLKGPLSLNMASLLLHKTGADLVASSALLSGIFGAGLGAGTWLAHVQDGTKRAAPSAARWLIVGAGATAALVASWFFGAAAPLVLPIVAAAWFSFALANSAAQALMAHRLQENVAAAGRDKKYVVGLSLTLGNVVITALRVLAGLIFFLAARSWQTGFGLFGALLIGVAVAQWLLGRAMSKEAGDVR